MKKLSYYLIAGLLLFSWECAYAQDTARIFSLGDLEDMVFMNHPIVKQAALLSDAAKASVLQSKGEFDPTLKSAFGRKLFGHTTYYNNWHNELKVPLYIAGADLKVGYDRNTGVYTNPETHTTDAGLVAVGLNIPLGAGLLIDARRSTLWQAKAMRTMQKQIK
ncbi:MAG: putative outer membrane protein [Bacteroidetes bacterium]|nr:putative outer membrane protein [Bacteroidota bacterium]